MRERDRESVREERSTPLCIPPPVARTASTRSSPCSSPLCIFSAHSVGSESRTPVVFPARVFHVKSCVPSHCDFDFLFSAATLICAYLGCGREGEVLKVFDFSTTRSQVLFARMECISDSIARCQVAESTDVDASS